MALFGHPSLYLLCDLRKINNSESLYEFGGDWDVPSIFFKLQLRQLSDSFLQNKGELYE